MLGPPGSGKTHLLVERYRALASAGHAGDILVLTYSRDSVKRLTEMVLGRDTAHIGPAPVWSYNALAAEVLAAAGIERPAMLNSFDEHLLLDHVVERSARDLASDFRAIHASLGFKDGLREIFHVLLQNNITGERLRSVQDAATSVRLADVLLLYSSFLKELRARNLVTYANIAAVAVEAWEQRRLPHPLERAKLLLIDDFQDVDAGQFELVRAIAPPGGSLAVNVFGDPMGPVFGSRGTDDRFLRDVFPALYDCDTLYLPARCVDAPALESAVTRLLEETIGEESAGFLPPTRPGGGSFADIGGLFANAGSSTVRLDIANDEVGEVQVAAARVASLIAGGGHEAGDIVVMANDKSRYDPLIEAAFERCGVPLVTGRVRQTAFTNFVRAVLGVVDDPDDDIAVRSVITSPLFAHLDETCLEYEGDALDKRRRYDVVREFAIRLAKEVRTGATGEWMRRIIDRCLRPVCESCHAKDSEEAPWGMLSRLMEEWEQYAAAADGLGRPAGIRRFVELAGLLATRPRGVVASGDEVPFLSFREANGLTRPVTIVLGCSELLVPSVKRRPGVMPVEALQTALDRVCGDDKIRVHGAGTQADHLREELHLLYIALTRSAGDIYLSAPRSIDGEDLPAPSAILGETVAEVIHAADDRDEAAAPPVRFARTWVHAKPSTTTSARLERVSPVGALWNTEPPEQRPVELEAFSLSKTSIEAFLQCERRFFYSKVLRIPEDESAPLKVGQLFHEVMALLMRRFPSKRALEDELDDNAIRETIDRLLRREEVLARQKFFVQTLRHHLELMVKAAISIEKSVGDGYEVEGVEVGGRFEYKGWKFTGRYDRVDESTIEGVRLVDYKTGEFRKRGVTLREKTLHALDDKTRANWQVPLYAWGYKVNHGRMPDVFKYVVVKAGEDPFFVTLFLRDELDQVPASATAKGQAYQAYSYLLSGDVEAIMDEAVQVAETIFASRPRFTRTTVLKHCQSCSFRRLCNREQQ